MRAMGDENQTIPGNGRLPRQYPSEVDQGSTKVTLPDAKTPSPIEKLTQDITPPGSPAPVVPGTLGIAGVWSASTLDALDTELICLGYGGAGCHRSCEDDGWFLYDCHSTGGWRD